MADPALLFFVLLALLLPLPRYPDDLAELANVDGAEWPEFW